MIQKKGNWFVYMLECCNGKIYTGITTDLNRRFMQHLQGRGAKFTQRNKPSHILAFTTCDTRSQASELEWQVKQLTATQKRALSAQWRG